MGHERVGFLPKTKRWSDLVSRMGSAYSSDTSVALVAAQTLQNVHKRYEMLSRDGTISNTKVLLRDGINTAFGGPADLDVERNPEKVLDFL